MKSEYDETPNTMPAHQAATMVPRTAAASATGGLDGMSASVSVGDLSADKLIHTAPRVTFKDVQVPSLGGIPLLSKLGQGGMGAVYYGIHPRLHQEVAVKVLPFEMAERHTDAVQRFQREAQLAARVKSPHLVGVLDVNQDAGLFYLVMEYVDGQSGSSYLRDCQRKGAIGVPELAALDVCIAACEGLSAAHSKGVIHRDLKPDNILIPRDEATKELKLSAAKLSDLGLARSEELEQEEVTRTGVCMGTPGYMSPEQASNARACGKPADVFSLGATLYAMLCGHAPFASGSLINILNDTINKPHTPVRKLRPDISAPTAELIDRCLDKQPERRFVDAHALLAALKIAREALGEPQQTMIAVAKVNNLLHEKEYGEALRQSILHTLEEEKPANESRLFLWAAIFLMIVSAGAAAYYFSKQEAPRIEAGEELVVQEGKSDAALEIEGKKLLEKLSPNTELMLDCGNGKVLEVILIKPGKFSMGSPDTEPERNFDRESLHSVTISKPFYISKYPVTQEQYEEVMAENPSEFKGFRHPVEKVTWSDAINFCDKLNSNSNLKLPAQMKVQLPTEAQWEYACRAGTSTAFNTGNTISTLLANYDGNQVYNGGIKGTFRRHTVVVGSFPPNAWGVCDMHGNVYQWCQDAYTDSYEKLPAVDPICNEGTTRILRGGAWNSSPRVCRSAYRGSIDPTYRSDFIGFRVVVAFEFSKTP